jgi:hypothetical protein
MYIFNISSQSTDHIDFGMINPWNRSKLFPIIKIINFIYKIETNRRYECCCVGLFDYSALVNNHSHLVPGSLPFHVGHPPLAEWKPPRRCEAKICNIVGLIRPFRLLDSWPIVLKRWESSLLVNPIF